MLWLFSFQLFHQKRRTYLLFDKTNHTIRTKLWQRKLFFAYCDFMFHQKHQRRFFKKKRARFSSSTARFHQTPANSIGTTKPTAINFEEGIVTPTQIQLHNYLPPKNPPIYFMMQLTAQWIPADKRPCPSRLTNHCKSPLTHQTNR